MSEQASSSAPAAEASVTGGEEKKEVETIAKVEEFVRPSQAEARVLMKKPAAELTTQEKLTLCMSFAEECVSPKELFNLLDKKPLPRCYDGFEPSGRMHIAQGVLKSIIVNRLTHAGCEFVFWVADWFAMLNDKMGGDLKKIQTVGKYMIEVWKSCGMNMDKVKFAWSSEHINEHPDEYWPLVMNISRKFTVSRVKRCAQIMGRKEGDTMPAAQILYPCMQCADIFYLKADICQLGLDQRKVNMLAREYCDVIKKKLKPVILSHHMIAGLKEGQEKMSKSDPNSAIFMEDDATVVNTKIKKAFCPPEIIEGNPIIDYIRHIVFAKYDSFTVDRKDGTSSTYNSILELETEYKSGALHPSDLKPALAKVLNEILEPVREHFKNDVEAKKLLQTVRKYKTTR